MFLCNKLLKFRPNVLSSCIISSIALHGTILVVVFSGKLLSGIAFSTDSSIPVEWITIASESQSEPNNIKSKHINSEETDSIEDNAPVHDNALVQDKSLESLTSVSSLYHELQNKNRSQQSNSNSNFNTNINSNSSVPDTSETLLKPSQSSAPSSEEGTTLGDSSFTAFPEADPESFAGSKTLQESGNPSASGSQNYQSAGRGLEESGGLSGDSKGSGSGGSGSRPPAVRTPPTPVPTPMPTPVPTPMPTPVPEVFQCLSCPRPTYPRAAHQNAHSGSVQVIIDVAPSGAVLSAALGSSSGSPELDQAALGTVQTWQFTPTADGRWGVPVYVDFVLE